MQTLVDSSLETALMKEFLHQKSNVKALKTEGLKNRIHRLKKLRTWIQANRRRIHEAMYADFRKHPVEVDGIEIFHVLSEIKTAIDNLDRWASPKKVDAPVTMLGTKSRIEYEPRGVCLILSPWNYPFSLCVGPLVSALAAGNSVIIKPSEFTVHVSALLKKMVSEIFEPSVVTLFEGGSDVSQKLLKLPFDHIFFTGSPPVGKIVMKAAAEHLTSVTLELGGKSPSIITGSASLRDAARRTAVAKFVNNGQTCVAPDYVLVDEKIVDRFNSLLIDQIKNLFTEHGETFERSEHYCRIVNGKNFERLQAMLQEAVAQGGKIIFGGDGNQESRFMHPTVISDVPPTSRMMNEEIFGPILPVVVFKELDEAIALVNQKPKPLALYIFSEKKTEQQRIIRETTSGGVCINECGIHFLHHNLPFGGVNHSGMGKSHGYHGFLAFSNEKPVLKQRKGLTSVSVFYPPYTARSKKLMEWFLRLF
ncbi:MAG TPA: aldehyde dehydrogenase family protein [Chryseolinea sp.]